MSLAETRRASVASLTWKLLWLRARIFWSTLRHGTRRRKIGTAALALLALALFGGVFWASLALLTFLRSPRLEQLPQITQLLEALPTLMLSGAFLMILVTSFGVLLQSLYLARDMEFLVAAPIPVRAVFLSKMIQAILPNFALLALLSLPLLFGLGASAGFQFLFYPLVVLLLVCMALAAAGLSSLLVMAVVRVIPARRVAEALAAVGAVLSLLCSQTGNLTRGMTFTSQQTSQMMDLVTRLNSPWSPFAWAGRGLIAVGHNDFRGLASLGLMLALTVLVFVITLRACEVLYQTGWSQMQVGTRRRLPARSKAGARATSPSRKPPRLRLLPRAVAAILVKDAYVMQRDPRNLSQMVTPLLLGILYAILLARSGGQVDPGQGEAPAWFMRSAEQLLAQGSIVLAFFIGWIILQRLGMIAFSQEGRSYWMIKSAPVSSERLLLAKALIGYLPTLVICEGFFIASALLQGSGPVSLLYGAAVVALALAGLLGICLAFGATSVNLEWDDPRHMVRASVGCVAALASMAYMGVAAAFFLGLPVLIAMLGGTAGWGQLSGLVLGGGLSITCALVPPYLLRHRVARIGEAS
jgi:ABC-2 type transport system permease protein